jgi:uroporphyrinogen decarboxylase
MEIFNKYPNPQPQFGRLLKALLRQGDPGFIPLLELFADPEIISATLNEPLIPSSLQANDRSALQEAIDQKIRFWHQLGYDAFWQGASLEMPGLQLLESEDTAPLSRQKRRWVDEKAGMITCWEEFENYPWPKPEDIDLYPLEYAAKQLPEGMGLLAEIMGALEPVMWLMGYETMALALYDQPDLIEAMFDRIGDIFTPLAQSLVQMERVIALWMGDDMGHKTGTMISPTHLRKYAFPYHKRIARIAHNQGIPFLLHSCGDLDAIMDELIKEIGIDAKHSFEDVIEPVEIFAARYSDHISIIGGVDLDLLVRGTEEQVRNRTRHILEACAPTRAYVLGSGNSIANYIPIENFLAMVDEGWQFNRSN